MSQKIGNVGLLDLSKATEESIKDIEEVGNVGVVLYSQETAHLMSRMNIGNIGKSLKITKDFQLQQGVLTIDKNYVNSIQEPQKFFIMGVVIIKKDVEPQMLTKDKISLSGIGKVYAPENVYGQTGSVVMDGLMVSTYEGAPPKVENGDFTLTNAYLDGQAEPLNLIVNGVLHLAGDLDVKKFEDSVSMLEVNGVVTIPGEMEPSFYKKNPVINGVVEAMSGCRSTDL